MITAIRGKLFKALPTHVEIETKAGVSYTIKISKKTYEGLPPLNGDIRLQTYLSVSERVWQLYGFKDQDEADSFEQLTKVEKVGPAIAMGILSEFTYEELCAAIHGDDVKALTKAKGVGKKSAELIVMRCKDYFPAPEKVAPEHIPVEFEEIPTMNKQTFKEVRSMLINLGLKVGEAEQCILAFEDGWDGPAVSAEEAIREILPKIGAE